MVSPSMQQLHRFRSLEQPLDGIGAYLAGLVDEADRRGYRFNRKLIGVPATALEPLINVSSRTAGLRTMASGYQTDATRSGPLAVDNPSRLRSHPIFRAVRGEIESWEKVPPSYPA